MSRGLRERKRHAPESAPAGNPGPDCIALIYCRATPRSRPSRAIAGGKASRETITRHINAHYLANLAVEQTADAVGLNPRDMMRLFQSHSAMSVWEYVLRLRICHAQRLLITTNKKITDIALESGFGSVAPFYAAFEKLAGQAGLKRIRQGRSTR